MATATKSPTVAEAVRTIRMAGHKVLPAHETGKYTVDGTTYADIGVLAMAADIREGKTDYLALPPTASTPAPAVELHFAVPLDRILPNPWQPRLSYAQDAIAVLAADILEREKSRSATRGLLQVPVGRIVDADGKPRTDFGDIRFYPGMGQLPYLLWEETDAYLQLAYGHSRWQAFEALCGDDEVNINDPFAMLPVDLVEWTDEEMATAAWSENNSRRDLNAWEEATAIQRMIADFGWTQEAAADHLKLSRATITNKLRLLRLPDMAADQLRDGKLSERQAAALLPLADLPPHALEPEKGMPYYRPASAIADAPKQTSDKIRERVADIMRNSINTFDVYAAFVDTPIEASDIVAPVCRACPWFREKDGKLQCLDDACFHRKKHHWLHLQADRASAALGIPRLARGVSGAIIYGVRHPFVPRMIELGCDHLRIDPSPNGADHVDTPDGSMIARIFLTGDDIENNACSHLEQAIAEQRAAESTSEDPALVERRARIAESEALLDQVRTWLEDGFRANDAAVWATVLWALGTYTSLAPDQVWTMDLVYQRIAASTLRSNLGYAVDKTNPKAIRDEIERRFALAGAPSPFADVGAQTLEVEA